MKDEKTLFRPVVSVSERVNRKRLRVTKAVVKHHLFMLVNNMAKGILPNNTIFIKAKTSLGQHARAAEPSETRVVQ